MSPRAKRSTSPDRGNLHDLQPDPLEPAPESVKRYVAALQELAGSEPDVARRRAWDQIRLAGRRAATRPDEAADSLNRIFRLGTPPKPELDGPYRGILVTMTTWRASDTLIRGLSSAWMPWLGKRFDARTDTGDNLLTRAARFPAGVIWPSYRLEDAGEGNFAAFRFRTHVDPGKVDPDRETLKIDYDSDENPTFLIRDILDELVQVVPGAYLGKVLLRRGKGPEPDYRLIGYFALEPPETVRVEEPAAAELVPEPAPA